MITKSKLHFAWALMLLPLTLVVCIITFLTIALVNLSFNQAKQFFREYFYDY